MAESSTEVGGERIFWRSSRALTEHALAAQTIVLIHGLIVSGKYMLPTAEILSQNYLVVVPDLPGYGDSSRPERCKNIRELAEIMRCWLNTIGIKHCTLVANSFGCHVAAEMALQDPAAVDSLVLIGPPDGAERRLLVQIARLLSTTVHEHPSLIPLVARDFMKIHPARAAQTFAYMTDHDLHEALCQARIRTLLVHGENDPIAPARWMQETAAAVQHAQLHMLAGAGHSTNYSHAAATAELIQSFLQTDRQTWKAA